MQGGRGKGERGEERGEGKKEGLRRGERGKEDYGLRGREAREKWKRGEGLI